MSGREIPKPIDAVGVPLTPFKCYDEAINCVDYALEGERETFCVAINPRKIYYASKDARMRKILHSAQIHICDGVGAALAVQLLYGIRLPRITGIGLFLKLMEASTEREWPVFLLGASKTSNMGACKELKRRHPNLPIVGNQHGYFDDSEEVIADIYESGAELLFVALGSPKQEKWIYQHRDRLPTFCMGVGGSFDVLSGEVKRAPRLFRRTGTEWFYRFIERPQRWRRPKIYPRFCVELIKALIDQKGWRP